MLNKQIFEQKFTCKLKNGRKEVKSRLRTALEAYNSNPTNISKKFGVNQKTLNNQINSNTAVSLSTILLISEALPEMSLEWLLRGKGDMSLASAPVVNSHM